MTLAREYHWTPEQVDRLDPAFVDELMLARMAQQDHDLLSADSKDNPDLMKAQAKRRAEIVRWKYG